jgi:hypothetical protein
MAPPEGNGADPERPGEFMQCFKCSPQQVRADITGGEPVALQRGSPERDPDSRLDRAFRITN